MQYVRHDDEARGQVGEILCRPHPCLGMIFLSFKSVQRDSFSHTEGTRQLTDITQVRSDQRETLLDKKQPYYPRSPSKAACTLLFRFWVVPPASCCRAVAAADGGGLAVAWWAPLASGLFAVPMVLICGKLYVLGIEGLGLAMHCVQ